jgi:hypothetical protein
MLRHVVHIRVFLTTTDTCFDTIVIFFVKVCFVCKILLYVSICVFYIQQKD